MKPEYLYKYISLEDRDKDINGLNDKKMLTLKENCVWFSRPDILNDPFELKGLYMDYDQLKKDGASIEDAKHIETYLCKICVIASFTDTMEKNMPMWAYYANNSKGFCVKYKVTDSKRFFPVKYEEQRKPVLDAAKKMLDLHAVVTDPTVSNEERFKAGSIIGLNIGILFQNYSIKHISWKHENEYRAFQPRPESEDSLGKNVSVSDMGLIVDSIYTGYDCEYHEQIKTIADELHIPCYKCKLDEKEFLIVTE